VTVSGKAERRGMNAGLIALGVLGLLSGVGAYWVASHAVFLQSKIPSPLLALAVGWSLLGCGLLSWQARPDNRLGPVMVLTGFAWFASVLQEANDAAVATIGAVFSVLYLAGFLYVGLSFPSGRLPGMLDRALMVTALGLVTIVQLTWLLVYDPGSGCDRCVANLFEVHRDDALANWLVQFQRIGGLAVIAVTVGLLVLRLVRASRPQRRTVIPVLLAGIVALSALAVSVVADATGAAHRDVYGRIAGYAFAVVPVAVLVAFLQRRLARGAVAGLVVELGEPRAAVGLAGALSRALGDPSLSVGYWFPAESRYVDADGKPIELPDLGGGRMSTVVERGGQPVAVLIHDPALQDNDELVESVCAAAGLTLENERLQAELRARLSELHASRARLVEATDTERRRIERDLHDGTQQRLVSIAISLGLLESRLPPGSAQVRPIVRETRESLMAALAELRELTQGIHPTILVERGLATALDELCRRAALPAHLQVDLDRRLPDQVESAAYFLVSEALTNAAKHSHASEIRVQVTYAGQVLSVEVADDGIGGAAVGRGTGLRGLTDRVEALGGALTVSSPPGRGTTVHAEFPCA
jgi:signal transduction histidine kinase